MSCGLSAGMKGLVLDCSRLTFRRFRKFKVGNSRESFTLLGNRESFKKQNVVFCITVYVTFYYAFCNVIVLTNSVGLGASHWFTLKITGL